MSPTTQILILTQNVELMVNHLQDGIEQEGVE